MFFGVIKTFFIALILKALFRTKTSAVKREIVFELKM